jgi:Flp pilus assembly protein TadD
VDPAAPSIAAPPAGHPDSDLAAAIDVLHRARGALRAGQPEQAIDLLRRNAALLDAGPFAEEAQAARASALCQLGRTQEAQAAIDRFLRVWPASPLATRLRDGCGALGGIGATPAK